MRIKVPGPPLLFFDNSEIAISTYVILVWTDFILLVLCFFLFPYVRTLVPEPIILRKFWETCTVRTYIVFFFSLVLRRNLRHYFFSWNFKTHFTKELNNFTPFCTKWPQNDFFKFCYQRNYSDWNTWLNCWFVAGFKDIWNAS